MVVGRREVLVVIFGLGKSKREDGDERVKWRVFVFYLEVIEKGCSRKRICFVFNDVCCVFFFLIFGVKN